jgi:hypothetical protein
MKRIAIQASMMMMAVSQLLGRALAYSLMAVSAGKALTALAVVLEVSVFFLYKIATKDFYYSNFKVGGILRIFLSCLERFTVKIIADFSSIIVTRNPNEMGGL